VSGLSTEQSECASQLQFDRYFGGELTSLQRATFELHVQRCERCAARREALGSERAEFLARVPNWDSLHQPRARRRARWPWLSGAALTLAAAAAFLLLVPFDQPSEAGVRLKGRPSVNLYVKRAGRVMRASSGDTFVAGDLLRVTYNSRYPVYLALLQRDSDGVMVQYPVDAAQTALVQAGRDVALDFGIQLDAHAGVEQLVALFCDRPTELEPVRASLQRARTLPSVMHCQLDELVLNKRASLP
jgi:hypothetical protein